MSGATLAIAGAMGLLGRESDVAYEASIPRLDAWMQTRSGQAYHFEDPTPESIRIDDIASSLSKICRFGGHTSEFYSVAEHSVLVSMVVPKEHAFAGLMHDATEAYVGDMVRPLKHAVGQAYSRLEAIAWAEICRKFGIMPFLDKSVKHADNTVLLRERDALMAAPPIPWSWADGLEPARVRIRAYEPRMAERFFMERYKELTSC